MGWDMPIQVSNQPDAFRDFERSGWNAVSEGYEVVFGPLTAQSVDVTLDAAGVIGGCDVLDVCTGHGVNPESARLAPFPVKVERGEILVDLDEAGTR